MRGLSGRTVIITGAGAGIGAALSRRFAEEGCAVGLLDMDGASADAVATEIVGQGGRALAVAADVTDGAAVAEAVARVSSELGAGTLHLAVVNAGIARAAMLKNLDEAAFRAVLDVHLMGTYNLLRAGLDLLPEDGS